MVLSLDSSLFLQFFPNRHCCTPPPQHPEIPTARKVEYLRKYVPTTKEIAPANSRIAINKYIIRTSVCTCCSTWTTIVPHNPLVNDAWICWQSKYDWRDQDGLENHVQTERIRPVSKTADAGFPSLRRKFEFRQCPCWSYISRGVQNNKDEASWISSLLEKIWWPLTYILRVIIS